MPVRRSAYTDMGLVYDRFAQISDATTGQYLTPRDPKNAKLLHIVPTIVYEQQQNSNDKQRSPAVHIHLDLRTKKIHANDTTLRIANVNATLASTVLSTTTVCTPMTGPTVRLQDLGDAVATWLTTVTGIAGCRLTAIGPQYHRSVVPNPDQQEPVPSIRRLTNRDDDDDDEGIKEQEQTETDEDGTGIKIIEETEEEQPFAAAAAAAAPVVSLADEAPFLLTSTASLLDLNIRLKARQQQRRRDRGSSSSSSSSVEAIPMERFRPNIVVTGTQPWEEDTWQRIRIGGQHEFYVWQRCGRCTMTTIDPHSLQRGAGGGEPLATLGTFRERAHGQRNFGMHLIPVPVATTAPSSSPPLLSSSSSVLYVGDTIEVLEYDQERLQEWKRLFSSDGASP